MDRPYLIVVGDNAVANEVARFGVAYSARVFGVRAGGRPEIDEPWVEGVEWLEPGERGSATIPDEVPGGAVVWADDERDYRQDADADRFADRFVVLTREGDVELQDASVIVAQSPEITDVAATDVDEAGAIPLGRLAMALLRAALDIDIPRRLGPKELHHLGDAVMLQ